MGKVLWDTYKRKVGKVLRDGGSSLLCKMRLAVIVTFKWEEIRFGAIMGVYM